MIGWRTVVLACQIPRPSMHTSMTTRLQSKYKCGTCDLKRSPQTPRTRNERRPLNPVAACIYTSVYFVCVLPPIKPYQQRADLNRGVPTVGCMRLAMNPREPCTTNESPCYPRSLARSQAFDRDGNGALEVSDLADLLTVLKGISGKPSSAGSGTMGTPTGAAATGLGLEAAMDAMDEDSSGQVLSFLFLSFRPRPVRLQKAARKHATLL